MTVTASQKEADAHPTGVACPPLKPRHGAQEPHAKHLRQLQAARHAGKQRQPISATDALLWPVPV